MHPLGQFGAIILVSTNGKITYITANASTLPDQPTSDTIKEGIYKGVTRIHRGQYNAIRIQTLEGSNTVPGYCSDGKTEYINLHAADSNLSNTSNYSEGCITIQAKDYIKFLVKSGVFDEGKYPDGNYPTATFDEIRNQQIYTDPSIKDGIYIGNVIIDRSHISPELIFYK